MKVLHFLADSPYCEKLQQAYVECLSDFEHIFLLYTNNNTLTYSKGGAQPITESDLDSYLSGYSALIVNGVILPLDYLSRFSGIKILSLWGYEFYEMLPFQFPCFGNLCQFDKDTRRYLNRKFYIRRICKFLLILKWYICRDGFYKRFAYFELFDNLMCATHYEYNLVTKTLENLQIQHVAAPILPIEYIQSVKEKPEEKPDPHYVFLGNSATESNNHISALKLIAQYEHINVVVPLSYGKKKYAKDIEAYGIELLGKRFFGLTEFLPKEDYLNVINKCEFLLMNHIRQQALGNILAGIISYKTVILKKESVLAKCFSEIGIRYRTASDENPFRALSLEKKEANIALVNERFGSRRFSQMLSESIGKF